MNNHMKKISRQSCVTIDECHNCPFQGSDRLCEYANETEKLFCEIIEDKSLIKLFDNEKKYKAEINMANDFLNEKWNVCNCETYLKEHYPILNK